LWAYTHCYSIGLKLDAQTALDYVLADPNLSKTPIVCVFLNYNMLGADFLSDSLWTINRRRSCDRPCQPQPGNGKPLASVLSLGTHKSFQIRALILENTFTSLPSLIPNALPLLSPFSFLCHQKWESALKIPLIPRSTPMLLLSGVMDEVVPREQMQALWEVVGRRQGVKAAEGEGDNETKENGQVGEGRSKFVEFAMGTHSEQQESSFGNILSNALVWV
jgi:hypothetical protein